ncbi:TetR family transcriptional regulator C-terminal domain-containing protein [Flavobacterium sp. DGU11]|uniref:TetR family transcriptional regulator C-terminal domain-containing protein n=1 Tax=Flavobacterium arundinis TaxID=3139143 RepID=A0ABU9HZ14_9FLAO
MATKKNIIIGKSGIISKYSDYCLMHGKKPDSVYKFAKENGFEESHFYQYFPSFDILEHHYFLEMFNHTLEILEKSPGYEDYSGPQKISAFYFTFFELATANRSFIIFALEEGGRRMRNMVKLKELRKAFTAYAELVLEKPFDVSNYARAGRVQDKALREGAWLQLLSIFQFWMQDSSGGFEKTDIFIEKSVKASADLVYNSPLQSLFDLGKFIWKEKFTA